MVNIVGDHATYLRSTTRSTGYQTVAQCLAFVRTSTTTAQLSWDAVDAIIAAQAAGQVATLILPPMCPAKAACRAATAADAAAHR